MELETTRIKCLLITKHSFLAYRQNECLVISRQTLTNKLRELEDDGILNRIIYAQVPPKVEYEITELGLSLSPIISEMSKWGLKFVKPNE